MSTKATPSLLQVLGGILLVAGSCIGAGMLALPVVTGIAGFVPSIAAFLLCWLFMLCTGLLLLEVNLWLGTEVSIVTMAHKTLGRWGRYTAWTTFLFLFYCLMVAYTSASGTLVSDFAAGAMGISLPPWVGSLGFAFLIGYVIYLGTGAVDRLNRFLMLGLIAAYVALVVVGLPKVEGGLLGRREWSPVLYAIPVILVSFGFHNMIPSMTTYLRRNVRRLRWTVVIGSALPLVVYLLWESIILGIIPFASLEDLGIDKEDLATQMLLAMGSNQWVVITAQYFAFFAILTSFLAQALSLKDFLADGLKIVDFGWWNRLFLIILSLLPPFVFGMFYPNVFIQAIEVAGGIGAMILFGVLPCLMVWVGRYRLDEIEVRMLPGGRLLLLLLIVIASTIVIGEVALQVLGA